MNQAVNKIQDEVAIKIEKIFYQFLTTFKERNERTPKYCHSQTINDLASLATNTMIVDFNDVISYDENLATAIQQGFYRILPYLNSAVQMLVKERAPKNQEITKAHDYFVGMKGIATLTPVRQLRPSHLGTMTKIIGQVVRAHPVHPELYLGTFTCLDCQAIIKDVTQQFKYTLPTICSNSACGNRQKFNLDLYKSKFLDFQRIRVQECQAELPRGSTPRCLEIIVRGDCVDKAQAGDLCEFVGCPVVIPDVTQLNLPGPSLSSGPSNHKGGTLEDGITGLKMLGVRQLNYRMAFIACNISHKDSRIGNHDDVDDAKAQLTTQEWEKVCEMTQDPALYEHLKDSMFPTISGQDEVKRGVLLQLFGGVPKTSPEGVRLRGDINVCIMGDPSTGKSQVLQQVAKWCPRAVYTSGKSSSAAGLTAAVAKDEESGDFVIEAGALMLADNGICCIDEFDKMDIKDQVAIHEAMEQQTITIAKAGVKATLNARSSVLAAANPVNGRYDRAKPLRHNIQLSAPILSRFDLFFILLDECNEVVDYAIARRMVALQAAGGVAAANDDASFVVEDPNRQHVKYTRDDVRLLLNFSRSFKPRLTPEVKAFLVDEYKRLRQRDAVGRRSAWRITVRQLESMIRLSEAMARLHCKDFVSMGHAKEAARLLNKSIIRIEQPDILLDEHGADGHREENDDLAVASQQTDGDKENEVPVEASQEKQPSLRISFEEYSKIANLLVAGLRRASEETATRQEASDDDISGHLTRQQLVNWYLEECEGDIDDLAELASRRKIVERVIDRMLRQDKILIALQMPDEVPETAEGKEATSEDNKIIIVHPNYTADQTV